MQHMVFLQVHIMVCPGVSVCTVAVHLLYAIEVVFFFTLIERVKHINKVGTATRSSVVALGAVTCSSAKSLARPAACRSVFEEDPEPQTAPDEQVGMLHASLFHQCENG